MDKVRIARGRTSDSLARWAHSLRSAAGTVPRELDDERGQGLAEYALILSLIAIVAIAALAFFGLQISSVLTDPVNAELSGVMDIITP